MNNIAFDCVLFENCNLNCSHCFQCHYDNTIDVEYIKNLSNIVYPHLIQEVEKKNPDVVLFSIRGGEIFQDKLDDTLIGYYKGFIMDIQKKFTQDYPNKTIKIHIMSNGIYNNVDRVIKLLKEVGGKITLSYDAYGRFPSQRHYEIFFRSYNLLLKENLIKNIAITLTKQSIEHYIKNKDQLKVFKDSEIDFNYYVPTMRESELPSDVELYNFYRYLIDNKIYNCVYIKNIMDNIAYKTKIYSSCNCGNTTVFYKGVPYHSCNIYVPQLKLKDFYDDTSTLNDTNAFKRILNKGFSKRQCLTCPQFNNCSYYCWMMLCYKNYQISECPHKMIYNYITNNVSIIEDYKQWKHQ